MGLFNKKQTHSFADILRGLQHAISGAQGMLQAQQTENLSNFWNDEGAPLTQKIQLNGKDVEVPLLTLVPHSQLAMDEVEIKFKSRISGVAPQTFANRLEAAGTLPHADLQLEMDGIKAGDDDVMEVSVRFRMKDIPEGVARLTDEYNKQIGQ